MAYREWELVPYYQPAREVGGDFYDFILFEDDRLGLVEAHNASREMFGFPRLKKLLEERTHGASLIDVLLGELQGFTGEEWDQEDDVTLVTLQCMKP